mmetsp:Transcript_25931/g.46763  ORF Transcript_25931/g.46763 Transcript_25931/m.46763 type:complete len:130 (-) Transcript_25931:912-1301(-)
MSHRSIKIRPTQLLIAITPQNINIPTLTNVQHTNIQRPTTEIVHHDIVHIVTFVQPVRQCGSGGFFQDACHLETCQFEGAYGGVSLGGFEFGGDGDDGGLDIVVFQIVSCEGAEVMDDVGAYFGGSYYG